jgi:SAM-dependent methyltransferase
MMDASLKASGEVKPVEFRSSPCPLCGDERRKILGYPRVNALFASLELPEIGRTGVAQCERCLMIYAYPMPHFSPQTLARMYSHGYFQDYTEEWHRIRNVENPMRRFRRAQEALGRPVKRYLEVGAGQGFGLEAARRMGWDVHGQDISAEFAAAIKQRLGIDIHLGPLEESSYPKGHFDFIYMDSVLEHVGDPIAFMETLKGLLAPGGVLYAVLPNEDSLPNFLKDSLYRLLRRRLTSRLCPFDDSYHLLGFSKPSARFLSKRMGMPIAYMSCGRSYMHIEKFKRVGEGASKRLARRALGLVYLACDLMDEGINLEIIFKAE